MKKILVFLLLITGLVKSQVVVPKSTTTFSNINAVGSVTVGGNLRVSGSETVTGNAVINKVRVGSTTAPSATLDVTGTMSVSSTATITGALNTSTITSSSNLYLQNSGSTVFNSYGQQIASFTTNRVLFTPIATNNPGVPYYFTTPANYSMTAGIGFPTLQTSGSTRGWLTGNIPSQYEIYFPASTYTAAGASTITTAAGLYVEKPVMSTNMTATNIYGIGTNGNMLLGSAGLTGGNSGTIAVLSDAVFNVDFGYVNNPISDATTYYFGNAGGALSTILATTGNVTLPYNCTLVSWDITVYPTVAGSAETTTISLRSNNTTDYNLSTAINFSTQAVFSGTGLSQNYSAGDKINIKQFAQTYATNPTCYMGVTLWFVRRQ